ncbi:MAG: 50S ribosomal protein L29 [Candidatus Aenigmarchaeota archaeon]|nr:50S ribosomal protein L29 [Candidatus Aenigmarchaeota archaeon]
MAIIKMKNLKQLSEKELDSKLMELNLELTKEKALSEVGASVKNSGRIREIRKTIARILTIKKQKGGA